MKIKAETKPVKTYELVSRNPVAKFYYQGNHSHPVRRTVLIVEETKTHITGYEFRCGTEVRTRGEAMSKIRSYKKDKIAKWGDYSRLTKSSKNFMKRSDLYRKPGFCTTTRTSTIPPSIILQPPILKAKFCVS